jgi:hypothetical protein
MAATKPHKFISFVAMAATKLYKFIRFVAMACIRMRPCQSDNVVMHNDIDLVWHGRIRITILSHWSPACREQICELADSKGIKS